MPEVLERIEAELREIRKLVEGRGAVSAVAVSLAEAAQMLSCSSRHVSRMVMRGELMPVEVGGLRRIPVSQIQRLLESPPPPVSIKSATPKAPRYSAKAEFEKWKSRR